MIKPGAVLTTIALMLCLGCARTEVPQSTESPPIFTESKSTDTSWSDPVNGLQGRLILKRAMVFNGTPVINVSLELKNVAYVIAAMKVPWSAERMRLYVVDEMGAAPPEVGMSYSGPTMESFELTLPYESTIMFNISCRGMGIPTDQAGAIDLGATPEQCWIIPRDGKSYYIYGALEIPEDEEADEDTDRVWHGRLELPRVRLPLTAEPLDPVTLGPRIDELGARMLNGPDAAKAIDELSLIDDERVVPWYLKAMASGTSYNLKFTALDRLCRLPGDAALEGLKRGLAVRGEDIGNCATPAMADSLVNDIRVTAASGLARSPHPDAVKVLLSLANDPSTGVRTIVAQACGQRNTPASLELLKAMTADPDERVRREAKRLLGRRLKQLTSPRQDAPTLREY